MTKSNTARVELENYLSSLKLETKPAIHVNGTDHPTAVVVVDFGYPTPPVRLTSEQNAELSSRIRKYVKEMVKWDANIRINSDAYLGLVHWASINH